MFPLVKSVFHAFFFDPLAFTRWCRGALLAVAGSGFAFSEQLAALVSMPKAVTAIKIAAVVAGFIAGSITAGEKNEPKP